MFKLINSNNIEVKYPKNIYSLSFGLIIFFVQNKSHLTLLKHL